MAESRRVSIYINQDQATKSLEKLKDKSARLESELKNLPRHTEEYAQKSKELNKVNQQYERINKQLKGELGPSLNNLRSQSAKLRNELKHLPMETQEYAEKSKQLREVNDKISEHTKKVKGAGRAWQFIKQEIGKFGALATGALGAQQLIAGLDNILDRGAKLDDLFVDVQKTTDLTTKEVEELSSSLKKINTRSSRKELLQLARQAGKLGIRGTKNIEEFVEAADQINIALSEDLGKGAIKQLGKINDAFNVTEVHGYKNAMLKVGSALNELGAASNAQEKFLVNFTSRLQGVASNADISVENVLGLAATVDQLGLRAESSSTAIQKTIMAMFDDMGTFAKVARMEVDEFQKLLKNDANEALLAVLDGLNGNNEGLSMMVKKLKEMGLNSERARAALSTLSNQTEEVRKQQKIANDEFEKGTSLTEEFSKKNENLAAKLKRVQRVLFRAFVNQTVNKALEGLIGLLDEYMKVPMSSKLRREKAELNILVKSIQNTNDNQKLRNDLIDELINKYPKYFGNLDKDKVSNAQLAEELKKVNEQYEKRIELSVFEEDIKERTEAAKEAFREMRQEAKAFAKVLEQDVKQWTGDPMGLNEAIEKRIDFVKNAETIERSGSRIEVSDEKRQKALSLLNKLYDTLNDQSATYAEKHERIRDLQGEMHSTDLLEPSGNLRAAVSEAERHLEGMTEKRENYNEKIEKTQELEKQAAEIRKKIQNERESLTEGDNPKEDSSQDHSPDKEPESDEPSPDKDLDSDVSKEVEKAERALHRLKQEAKNFEQQIEQERMDAHEKEIAAVENKYNRILSKAEEYFNKQKINEEQFTDIQTRLWKARNKRIEQINEEHRQKELEKRRQLEEKIERMQMSSREKEIADTKAKYDHLIQQAKRYNLAVEELERMKQQELLAIKQEAAAAEMKMEADKYRKISKMTSEFSNVVSAATQLMAKEGEAATEHQKQLALIQLTIDTATAISGAVAQAQSVPYPANLAAIASGIAAVLGGIAEAKAIMSSGQTTTSSYQGSGASVPEGNFQASSPSADTGFAEGGFTGQGKMRDQTGHRVAGTVHEDEWVAPKWMVKSPRHMDTIKILEADRQNKQGFQKGGPTSTNYKTTTSQTERAKKPQTADDNQLIIKRLDTIINMLSVGVPFKGYFDLKELERNVLKLRKVRDKSRKNNETKMFPDAYPTFNEDRRKSEL